MSSIRDIAQAAGASVATVSRVVNDSGYVSAATRARVLKAIEDLQYTPNASARQLRRGASHMVGVVLPALDVPFFGIMAHVLEREHRALGHRDARVDAELTDATGDQLAEVRALVDDLAVAREADREGRRGRGRACCAAGGRPSCGCPARGPPCPGS